MGTPPPEELPAELRRRFEPIRTLGTGGFGWVLLARDLELGREVALKLARLPAATPRTRARFEREAALTAKVHHPHVVRLFDYGWAEDRAFLVYELVDGENLAAVLDSEEPPSLARWLGWARQGSAAIEALHRERILHRDLKPSNLLVRGDGTLVLADLGLARLEGPGQTLTATGAVVGTPRYIAPELWEGAEHTPAADQFAWGIVLAELLLGPGAIRGRPSPALVRPPGLDPALGAWVEALARATAPEPTARFPGLGALAGALEAGAGRLGSRLDEPAPWDRGAERRESGIEAMTLARAGVTPAPRPPPGSRTALGALVGLGVVALGLGWWRGAPEGAGPAATPPPGRAGGALGGIAPPGAEEAAEVLRVVDELDRMLAAEGVAVAAPDTVALRDAGLRRVLARPAFLGTWNRLVGRTIEWLRALRRGRPIASGAPLEGELPGRVLAAAFLGTPALAMDALSKTRVDAMDLHSSIGIGIPSAVRLDDRPPDPLRDSPEIFQEFAALCQPLLDELGAWGSPRPLALRALEEYVRGNLMESGPLGFRELARSPVAGEGPVATELVARAMLRTVMRTTSKGEIPCDEILAGLDALGRRIASGPPDGSPGTEVPLPAGWLRSLVRTYRRCRTRVSPEEMVAANAVLARLVLREGPPSPRVREILQDILIDLQMPPELIYEPCPPELAPLAEAIRRVVER